METWSPVPVLLGRPGWAGAGIRDFQEPWKEGRLCPQSLGVAGKLRKFPGVPWDLPPPPHKWRLAQGVPEAQKGKGTES